MDVSERSRRFIRATAVGALLSFDASVVFFVVPWSVWGSASMRSQRQFALSALGAVLLAVALLALLLLTLAAGVAAAVDAARSRRGRWFASFGVLVALAIVTPPLLIVSLLIASRNAPHVRDQAILFSVILFPAVALIYLVLPALALLFVGRRADVRMLLIGACVAYYAASDCIVLTLLFPDFGADPNTSYFFYFPPQAFVAVMMLIAAVLLSIAGGIICAIDGRLTRRPLWPARFLFVIVVGLLVPLLLAMQIHDPPLVPFSVSLDVVLYVAAGAAYLTLPVMALVYLRGSS